MRKTLVFAILLFALSLLSAASVYVQGSLDMGYRTNVFSDPLPQSGDAEYREDVEFLKRVNLGLSVKSDIFFHDWDTAGLSVKLSLDFPLTAESTKVRDPDSDDWYYYTVDSIDDQDATVILGVGPVFRYMVSIVDIMLDLRLAVGTYDLFDTVVAGLQADLLCNVFLSDHWFLSCGLAYEADLMRFVDSSKSYYFEDGFTMLTVGGFVGGGYLFGGRE